MLVCSNISWLLYYLFIFYFIQSSLEWCVAINVLATYTTLTTYFWMLCEGAYLQLLLIDAFHDDKKRVRGLLCVGWGLPLLITVPYYVFFYQVTDYCWAQFGDTNLFLAIPVVLIIILNVVFLSSVIKMLRSKLEAEPQTINRNRRNTAHTVNRATLKQAKAALFLIPILGINYLILPIRPESDNTSLYLQRLYDIVSAVTTSFQGFFVALLLCMTNSEVIDLIKKRWNQFSASRNLNISFTRLVAYPFNSRSDQISEV